MVCCSMEINALIIFWGFLFKIVIMISIYFLFNNKLFIYDFVINPFGSTFQSLLNILVNISVTQKLPFFRLRTVQMWSSWTFFSNAPAVKSKCIIIIVFIIINTWISCSRSYRWLRVKISVPADEFGGIPDHSGIWLGVDDFRDLIQNPRRFFSEPAMVSNHVLHMMFYIQ